MEYGTGAVMARAGARPARLRVRARSTGCRSGSSCSPTASASTRRRWTAAWEGPGHAWWRRASSTGSTSEAAQGAHHGGARGARARAARRVTYRLRDWGISRQRYWGAPIPVVYCERDGIVPVPGGRAARRAADDVVFTGARRLAARRARRRSSHTRCPRCGGPARRETDTMDTFVESSWYFAALLLAARRRRALRSRRARLLARARGVDQYIGGIEHAVLHLLYARFFTKVLRDLGFARRSTSRSATCSRRAW